MIDLQKVEDIVNATLTEIGQSIFVVGLNVRPGNNIFLEIDKEGAAVSISECVAVSRKIEHYLTEAGEIFSLEVSSAGIDRPLRHLKQFRKHVGRGLKVKTTETDGKIEGILCSADDTGIVVETREKVRVEGKKKKEWVVRQWPLNYPQIKEAKLVITF